MINSQLDNNINNIKLLETLASNLNVDYVSNGSNLKKMTDSYTEEVTSFSQAVDLAVGNMFLGTAADNFVELAGQQNGIYRKKYRTIGFIGDDNVATISIPTTAITSNNSSIDIKPFSKGDTVAINSQFSIQFMEDVFLSSSDLPVSFAARITSLSGNDTFTIQSGAIYNIGTTDTVSSSISPTYTLKFNRSVGIADADEDIAAFKLRLYESTYSATSGANSILSAITKQVPLIKFLKVDNIGEGRSAKVGYVYTDTLIDKGVDYSIGTNIIPLLQMGVEEKAIPGTLVDFYPASPLNLNINIDNSIPNPVRLTKSVLDNTALIFNRAYATRQDTLLFSDICEYLIKALSVYNVTKSSISIKVISNISSTQSPISDVDTLIDIPLGRFVRINSLTQGT